MTGCPSAGSTPPSPSASQARDPPRRHASRTTTSGCGRRRTPRSAPTSRPRTRYTDAVMKPTEPLQETLYKEMLGAHQGDRPHRPLPPRRLLLLLRAPRRGSSTRSTAARRGRWRRPRRSSSTSTRSPKGKKFMSLGAYAVSDDGDLLAYSTDNTGFREYTLHIKDLRTGRLCRRRVERVGVGRVGGRRQDAVLRRSRTTAKRPYRL